MKKKLLSLFGGTALLAAPLTTSFAMGTKNYRSSSAVGTYVGSTENTSPLNLRSFSESELKYSNINFEGANLVSHPQINPKIMPSIPTTFSISKTELEAQAWHGSKFTDEEGLFGKDQADRWDIYQVINGQNKKLFHRQATEGSTTLRLSFDAKDGLVLINSTGEEWMQDTKFDFNNYPTFKAWLDKVKAWTRFGIKVERIQMNIDITTKADSSKTYTYSNEITKFIAKDIIFTTKDYGRQPKEFSEHFTTNNVRQLRTESLSLDRIFVNSMDDLKTSLDKANALGNYDSFDKLLMEKGKSIPVTQHVLKGPNQPIKFLIRNRRVDPESQTISFEIAKTGLYKLTRGLFETSDYSKITLPITVVNTSQLFQVSEDKVSSQWKIDGKGNKQYYNSATPPVVRLIWNPTFRKALEVSKGTEDIINQLDQIPFQNPGTKSHAVQLAKQFTINKFNIGTLTSFFNISNEQGIRYMNSIKDNDVVSFLKSHHMNKDSDKVYSYLLRNSDLQSTVYPSNTSLVQTVHQTNLIEKGHFDINIDPTWINATFATGQIDIRVKDLKIINRRLLSSFNTGIGINTPIPRLSAERGIKMSVKSGNDFTLSMMYQTKPLNIDKGISWIKSKSGHVLDSDFRIVGGNGFKGEVSSISSNDKFINTSSTKPGEINIKESSTDPKALELFKRKTHSIYVQVPSSFDPSRDSKRLFKLKTSDNKIIYEKPLSTEEIAKFKHAAAAKWFIALSWDSTTMNYEYSFSGNINAVDGHKPASLPIGLLPSDLTPTEYSVSGTYVGSSAPSLPTGVTATPSKWTVTGSTTSNEDHNGIIGEVRTPTEYSVSGTYAWSSAPSIPTGISAIKGNPVIDATAPLIAINSLHQSQSDAQDYSGGGNYTHSKPLENVDNIPEGAVWKYKFTSVFKPSLVLGKYWTVNDHANYAETELWLKKDQGTIWFKIHNFYNRRSPFFSWGHNITPDTWTKIDGNEDMGHSFIGVNQNGNYHGLYSDGGRWMGHYLKIEDGKVMIYTNGRALEDSRPSWNIDLQSVSKAYVNSWRVSGTYIGSSAPSIPTGAIAPGVTATPSKWTVTGSTTSNEDHNGIIGEVRTPTEYSVSGTYIGSTAPSVPAGVSATISKYSISGKAYIDQSTHTEDTFSEGGISYVRNKFSTFKDIESNTQQVVNLNALDDSAFNYGWSAAYVMDQGIKKWVTLHKSHWYLLDEYKKLYNTRNSDPAWESKLKEFQFQDTGKKIIWTISPITKKLETTDPKLTFVFNEELQMIVNPYEKFDGTSNIYTNPSYGIERVIDHTHGSNIVLEDWTDGKLHHEMNNGLAMFNGIFGMYMNGLLSPQGAISEGIHKISVETASSTNDMNPRSIEIDTTAPTISTEGSSSSVTRSSFQLANGEIAPVILSNGVVKLSIQDPNLDSVTALIPSSDGTWHSFPLQISAKRENGEVVLTAEREWDYQGFVKFILKDKSGNTKETYLYIKLDNDFENIQQLSSVDASGVLHDLSSSLNRDGYSGSTVDVAETSTDFVALIDYDPTHKHVEVQEVSLDGKGALTTLAKETTPAPLGNSHGRFITGDPTFDAKAHLLAGDELAPFLAGLATSSDGNTFESGWWKLEKDKLYRVGIVSTLGGIPKNIYKYIYVTKSGEMKWFDSLAKLLKSDVAGLKGLSQSVQVEAVATQAVIDARQEHIALEREAFVKQVEYLKAKALLTNFLDPNNKFRKQYLSAIETLADITNEAKMVGGVATPTTYKTMKDLKEKLDSELAKLTGNAKASYHNSHLSDINKVTNFFNNLEKQKTSLKEIISSYETEKAKQEAKVSSTKVTFDAAQQKYTSSSVTTSSSDVKEENILASISERSTLPWMIQERSEDHFGELGYVSHPYSQSLSNIDLTQPGYVHSYSAASIYESTSGDISTSGTIALIDASKPNGEIANGLPGVYHGESTYSGAMIWNGFELEDQDHAMARVESFISRNPFIDPNELWKLMEKYNSSHSQGENIGLSPQEVKDLLNKNKPTQTEEAKKTAIALIVSSIVGGIAFMGGTTLLIRKRIKGKKVK